MQFSNEIRALFHSIYRNEEDYLMLVVPEFTKLGFSYLQIIFLTMQELNVSLVEAQNLLKL